MNLAFFTWPALAAQIAGGLLDVAGKQVWGGVFDHCAIILLWLALIAAIRADRRVRP